MDRGRQGERVRGKGGRKGGREKREREIITVKIMLPVVSSNTSSNQVPPSNSSSAMNLSSYYCYSLVTFQQHRQLVNKPPVCVFMGQILNQNQT